MTTHQLTEIEKAIARWEEAVSWIEKGWDCEDEYINDVAARHAIFQLLEIDDASLSAELQVRLEAADARYCAATVDDRPFSININASELDQERHWYWFRMPEEVSMQKAWETNPEFRCFVRACIPDHKNIDDNDGQSEDGC